MGKFKWQYVLFGLSFIIIGGTLTYGISNNNTHKADVDSIECYIQELEADNTTLSKSTEAYKEEQVKLDNILKEKQSELNKLMGNGEIDKVDVDTLKEENTKLIMKAIELLMNSGEYLGIESYYTKMVTEEEVNALDEKVADMAIDAIVDSLGISKLFKVINIVQDLKKLDSISSTNYSSDEMIEQIVNVIKEHGSKLNAFCLTESNKITSKELIECLASVEEIGNSYDTLRDMTSGEINEFGNWKDLHNSIKDITDKFISNEAKIKEMEGN